MFLRFLVQLSGLEKHITWNACIYSSYFGEFELLRTTTTVSTCSNNFKIGTPLFFVEQISLSWIILQSFWNTIARFTNLMTKSLRKYYFRGKFWFFSCFIRFKGLWKNWCHLDYSHMFINRYNQLSLTLIIFSALQYIKYIEYIKYMKYVQFIRYIK